MHHDNVMKVGRRAFIGITTGIAVGFRKGELCLASDALPLVRPRATAGDTAVQPQWDDRLTLTVGLHNADVIGNTDKAIQSAIDYVSRKGGGTVHLSPGHYHLRAAIRMAKFVRLIGSGSESVLIKEPCISSPLQEDSDWFDQEITIADPSGFQLGDDVCIRARNIDTHAPVTIKRTLIARSGNCFKLDRPLRENTWKLGDATVSTLFPLITAEEDTDFVIENLWLDGNKDSNDFLDGNYGGCIWLQECSRVEIRNVTAQNYKGDGISWQICHDVTIENCHSLDNAMLGLHPGSGSQRTIMRNNALVRNKIGLFFCWGVQHCLAENNIICDNGDCGISIGHRDHYNLIRNNEIIQSGRAGILFRPERGDGFTATGNKIENNRIVDSGGEEGIAIDIQGVTAGNHIVGNTLTETRGPAARIGIRIGAEAGENNIALNSINGFAVPIKDLRAG